MKVSRVHFMGIGGSGTSAAAGIAHEFGYIVDGCDLNVDSEYLSPLRGKIEIKKGHSDSHIEPGDILVVSPAVYYKYPPEPELSKSRNSMTWEKFSGTYLQKGKEVIAVSGTHGKSTTTALLGLVFAQSLDPTVVVGAKVKEWGANFRAGKGNVFITEADEFYDNFLNYSPEVIILNNIELDHPEYFGNYRALNKSFIKHITSLHGKKILIANGDNKLVRKLIRRIKPADFGIKVYFYTIRRRKTEDFGAKIISMTPSGTKFVVFYKSSGKKAEFSTRLLGDFNVANIMGVISLASLYGIEPSEVQKVLDTFTGVGRRMELIGEKSGIYVYDDYAHHPTAIAKTIEAVLQRHPISRVFAVVEPHSYSRVKKLIKGYAMAFGAAYSVIIAPIFKARDSETYGMSEEKLASVIENGRVSSFDSFEKVVSSLNKELKKNDVVLVMGAGKSNSLARMIYNAI